MDRTYVSLDLRMKQWDMERKIKEELKNPDFYNMYTRKTLREVMVALFPYETLCNYENRAFISMKKMRMYKHLQGYAILKGWQKNFI